MYLATVNIPGYLPMSDDPATFETAREAWDYLAHERMRGEEDGDPEVDEWSETCDKLIALSLRSDSGQGTVWGPSPDRRGATAWDPGINYAVTRVTL